MGYPAFSSHKESASVTSNMHDFQHAWLPTCMAPFIFWYNTSMSCFWCFSWISSITYVTKKYLVFGTSAGILWGRFWQNVVDDHWDWEEWFFVFTHFFLSTGDGAVLEVQRQRREAAVSRVTAAFSEPFMPVEVGGQGSLSGRDLSFRRRWFQKNW